MSELSNSTKKHTSKSRETIPLSKREVNKEDKNYLGNDG
jgi:hypothetical protein